MNQIFEDRKQAGRLLAAKVKSKLDFDRKSTIILALPRGGVPVAVELASLLGIDMDVLVVRKIGHPLQMEYGIGAITEDNFQWIDSNASKVNDVLLPQLTEIIENEKRELKRRIEKYRKNKPLKSVAGKTVILVDDGLATGVTARVASQYVKKMGARKVVLAIPACSPRTASILRSEVDQVICMNNDFLFSSVEQFYQDFTQVSDEEVISLLESYHATESIEDVIQAHAVSLEDKSDLNHLIEKISSAKIVMLGESSHGTHEFYEWRRMISEELIEKHGFNFIAVEGDWPPCAAVNRHIQSDTSNLSTREVLKNFKRWPTWMWANNDIVTLTESLRAYNKKRSGASKVGFYGLDVYSLFESIDEVTKQVQSFDPALARNIRTYYGCFEPFQKNEKAYAKSLFRLPEGCERQTLHALKELLQLRMDTNDNGFDNLFDAQQNALIVKNAENYYRTMITGSDDSWNVRDRHMMETLNILFKRYGPNAKGIVWAHNTHIGDYRATDMIKEGQINIGGLAREQWGQENVALIGFGTYSGEVTASHAWDGPIEKMQVPPSPPNTYEDLFHKAALRMESDSFYLWLKDELKDTQLSEIRGHRAIGVVYNPMYERHGNYVPTSLSYRYDGFIFVDHTHVLTPLLQPFDRAEIPETWPRGF
jgi:erythromycin esterase